MSYADIAAKGPKQSDEEHTAEVHIFTRYHLRFHPSNHLLLRIPHAIPEVQHDDSAVASVDSLAESGVHVADPTGAHQPTPQPSYAEQQKVAESLETAQDRAKKAANDVSSQSRDFKHAADADAQRLANETQKSASASAKDVKSAADQTSKDVKSAADQTSKNVKSAAGQAEKDAKSAAGQVQKDAQSLADKAEKKFEEVKKDAQPYVEKAEKKVEQAKKDAKPYLDKAEQKGKKAEEWAEKNKDHPVVIGNAAALAVLGGVLGIGAYRMHRANTLTWNVVGAWAGVVGVFAVGDYYVSQYFFQRNPPKK